MTPDPSPAIQAQGLAKRFDKVQAVSAVDFEVRSGELFGFLGPNGAGKTTTINMLTGLARPDAGTIHISGIDCTKNPRAAQHLIGVVPDESNLYPELTGFGNLCFCAALYGIGNAERKSRARELLDTFDLAGAANRKFGGYSKGMRRKLAIAAGIIHRPDILFLDEPTSGIDVASARQLRRLVRALHKNGTTIFLTTHYIEEAERLCDRIAFIVSGRTIRTDTVDNLIQPVRDTHVLQVTCIGRTKDLADTLDRTFPDLAFAFPEQGMIRVTSGSPVRVGPLVRFLEDRAVDVTEAKKNRSFERLLLAPLSFEILMLAKTSGAILFGILNALVPLFLAVWLTDLSQVAWGILVPAVFLISVASTFMGLFIAVAVSEVFEAQTFSNFFRFPMIFLCGLFFPVSALPFFLEPLAYFLPLTYGADLLHGAVRGEHTLPYLVDLAVLAVFCIGLFAVSLFNIQRRWIA